MTPPRFRIILYIKYSRVKLLNPTIAFWIVARPKKLRELIEPRVRVVLGWVTP